jgi:predicted MFS family arabinose efflux permease
MSQTRAGAGPAAASPHLSAARARWVLFVLFLVYVMNFVDRQVLAILIDPIKADLGVSDTAMGLLVGLAFAVFYTVAGIPIARWADTGSRRAVIVFSLTLWSLMTAASGLAKSFLALALARIGVGVGEAGGTPPSHSLLSDYFPPERRATALALYGNGIYVGAGLGILAGGLLEQAFGDWRSAFLAVGLAGLPLALLVRFTVPEVARGASEGRVAAAGPAVSFGAVMRFLFAKRSFSWLVVGACFQSVSGYGILNWGAVFLGRVHGLSYAEIGTWLGLTIMLGGCAGVSLGGLLADRLGRRDARWYMRLPAVVSLAALPFALGFLLLGDPLPAMISFVPFYAISNMYVGPLWSTAQNLARPDMRATASALLLFILNIAGLGVGPTLVGVLNDLLHASQGELAVRWSLLCVALAGGLASVFFWIGSARLREDLAARDA